MVILSEFLSRTCLTYCEFLELWKSGFVTFTSVNRGSDDRNAQSFPDCEPCCLANYTIQFVTPQDLRRLSANWRSSSVSGGN